MNIPTTIIGVIGAGILLVLTILKIVTEDHAQKQKEKEATDAKIDAISNADDVTRIGNELRDK
jgi:hypothetical protein